MTGLPTADRHRIQVDPKLRLSPAEALDHALKLAFLRGIRATAVTVHPEIAATTPARDGIVIRAATYPMARSYYDVEGDDAPKGGTR